MPAGQPGVGEAVQRPVRAAEQVAPPLLVERVGAVERAAGQAARQGVRPAVVRGDQRAAVRAQRLRRRDALPGEVQRRAAARLELGATVGRHPHENVVVDEPGRCGGTAGQRLDRVG